MVELNHVRNLVEDSLVLIDVSTKRRVGDVLLPRKLPRRDVGAESAAAVTEIAVQNRAADLRRGLGVPYRLGRQCGQHVAYPERDPGRTTTCKCVAPVSGSPLR